MQIVYPQRYKDTDIIAGDIVKIDDTEFILLYKGAWELLSLKEKVIITNVQKSTLAKMTLIRHNFRESVIKSYKIVISTEEDTVGNNVCKEIRVRLWGRPYCKINEEVTLTYQLATGYIYIDSNVHIHSGHMSNVKHDYIEAILEYKEYLSKKDILKLSKMISLDKIEILDI